MLCTIYSLNASDIVDYGRQLVQHRLINKAENLLLEDHEELWFTLSNCYILEQHSLCLQILTAHTL